ncbi:MAG: ABC transporter permease [Tatlockia sp.]|nr:ABC transporter permease [Tatlockia sp.]
MKLSSHFKTAKLNLVVGKLRTVLALLGILVGTFSVVILISAGEIATDTALHQFKGLGINLMALSFSPKKDMGTADTDMRSLATTINNYLETQIPEVLGAAPYVISNINAQFDKKILEPTIIASTFKLASILGMPMRAGRYISPMDKLQFFCVLGADLIKNTPTQAILGKQLRIGAVIFTVIGIAESMPENQFFPYELNNSIFISLETVPFLADKPVLSDVIMQLKPDADLDLVKTKLTDFFAKQLPNYQLNIQSARELLKRMATQQNIFTLLLGAIGGISLVVGGIGIMNIMLAAVAERKEEIGLRLALGAEPKDIRWMFLTEALLLATIGGGLGVLAGIIGTYVVSMVAGWTYSFYILPPIIGFGVTIIICVFFGYYPAYKASKLDPIIALRGA